MIKNALPLQEKYESIFCVVDLHAITVKYDPKVLRKNILEITKHFLAAGIDPKKSTLFVQSSISEHTELCWILNTIAKVAEMERMTQFKEKASKNKGNVNMGLFGYPILMAADILLYDTVVVPVGEDQEQHVELARTLANRFNEQYSPIFKLPKSLIKSKEEGGRIMGLDDPTKKMSKSADSSYNYISLTEDPINAGKKIMKAATDSGSKIKRAPDKPGITNLITIYSFLTGMKAEELEKKYTNKGYGDFKKDLAQIVENFLREHQEKLKQYDDNYVAQILAEGSIKLKKIAEAKMMEVKKAVGLL